MDPKNKAITAHSKQISIWSDFHCIDILNVIQIGAWVVSKDYITVYVNPTLCEILGYTEAEMLGRHLLDFMVPENKKPLQKKIKERMTGVSDNYAMMLVKKTGERITVGVYVNPLLNSNKEVIGVMALLVEKNKPLKESINILESVSLASNYDPNAHYTCANLKLHPQSYQYSIDGKKEKISKFSYKLLFYFLQNQDRVITRAELISKVWEDKTVSDRIIDVHIMSLRKKLAGFTGEIKTVYGVGYIICSSVQPKEKQS